MENSSKKAETKAETSPLFISGPASCMIETTSVTANKQFRNHFLFWDPEPSEHADHSFHSFNLEETITLRSYQFRPNKRSKELVLSESNKEKTSGSHKPKMKSVNALKRKGEH